MKDDLENLKVFQENSYFRRHSNIKIVSPSSRTGFILQATYDVWKEVWKTNLIDVEKNKEELFTEPSFDLLGRQIKLTFAPSNILNVNTFVNKDGIQEHYGIMYKISKIVAASLNASSSLEPPPDYNWGAIEEIGEVEIRI